mgnify:FL=1
MIDTACWLSILVPAYRVESYIGECLDSVLTQAGAGVEVVVIDDGSGDATATVIADRFRRHPGQVRVATHAVNQGIATTRNHLVDLARGDYLWFIDADDTMTAGAVDALRRIVDRHAPDLVLCDYHRRRADRERRGRTFAGPSRTVVTDVSVLLAGMFEAGQLHPWSKISSRSLWHDSLRFPDGRVFEDVAVMPRLAAEAVRAWHAPEPWIRYRQWAGSIVATMNPRKCVDLASALADFPADLRRRGVQLSDRAVFAMRHYAARHFVGAMRHLSRGHDAAECRRARVECRLLFLRSIEGEFDWLARQYLRRGWLWRWARLRHWFREAAQPRLPHAAALSVTS